MKQVKSTHKPIGMFVKHYQFNREDDLAVEVHVRGALLYDGPDLYLYEVSEINQAFTDARRLKEERAKPPQAVTPHAE